MQGFLFFAFAIPQPGPCELICRHHALLPEIKNPPWAGSLFPCGKRSALTLGLDRHTDVCFDTTVTRFVRSRIVVDSWTLFAEADGRNA
jgi:hypothetical protein